MPKKSEITIPAEDSTKLQAYVHKDTKKYFLKLFNAWKNQQIDKDDSKKSQNYFIQDALECLQKSRNIKLGGMD